MMLILKIVSGIFWLFQFAASLYLWIKLSKTSMYKFIQTLFCITSVMRIIWSLNTKETHFLPIVLSDVLLYVAQVNLLSIVTYFIFEIRCIMYKCIDYYTFEASASIYPNAITALLVVTSTIMITFFPEYRIIFRGIANLSMVIHSWVLVMMGVGILVRWKQSLNGDTFLRASYIRLMIFVVTGIVVCITITVMIILNMADHDFQNNIVFPVTIFLGEYIITAAVCVQSYRVITFAEPESAPIVITVEL